MDPMFAMPEDAKRMVWRGNLNGGGGGLGWESARDKHVVSFHMPASTVDVASYRWNEI